MKHIDKIDMRFKYTPSRLTDVAKTFARIRKQMVEDARVDQAKPVKSAKREPNRAGLIASFGRVA